MSSPRRGSPFARFARRSAFALFAGLSFVGVACSRESSPPIATPPSSSSRLNVLLISFDTTRADALSCYGAKPDVTPNVARLAREGVVFETAISPAPLTLPSHATMLTGLDPCRHSVRDNSTYALPDSAVTLAETLKEAGWRTFAVVASVILLPRFHLDQGFDRYDADGLVVTTGAEHERQADAIAAAALTQLCGREPFFGFVHFYDPHRPYRAPAELEKKFGDPYLAELNFADRELGRLLDQLRADGRLDRTLVLFTADHGEGRGDHGEATHGLLLHDATQRVPLVVRAPKSAPARVSGWLARLCDLMPTTLDLLGLAIPAGLDGRSLAPALRGEAMDAGEAYLESFFPRTSVDFAPLFGVRTLEWKFVLGARPHLWHLAEDPGEKNDVAAANPQIVAAMTSRLLHLRDERGPALAASVQRVTGDELAVFGGLGYVASSDPTVSASDASDRPDPYDEVAGAEAISQATLDGDVGKLEELARRYPRSGHVHFELGTLYGKRGENSKALDELLAAATLRPGSPDVHVQVALAAYLAKRTELVRPQLESAIALEKCPAQAWFMLSQFLAENRETLAARATLGKLLERTDLSDQDRRTAQELLRKLGG